MNRCRGLQKWTQLATRNSDGPKLRLAQNRSHIATDHPCERLTTFTLLAWTGRYSPSSELRTDPTVRFPPAVTCIVLITQAIKLQPKTISYASLPILTSHEGT